MQESKRSKIRQATSENDYISEESGEVRLLLAILEQAIIDLLAPKKEQDFKIARRSAKLFLLSSKIDDYSPYSFPWICESLDINPKKLRQKIFSLYESKDNNLTYQLLGRIHNLRGTGDHTVKKP